MCQFFLPIFFPSLCLPPQPHACTLFVTLLPPFFFILLSPFLLSPLLYFSLYLSFICPFHLSFISPFSLFFLPASLFCFSLLPIGVLLSFLSLYVDAPISLFPSHFSSPFSLLLLSYFSLSLFLRFLLYLFLLPFFLPQSVSVCLPPLPLSSSPFSFLSLSFSSLSLALAGALFQTQCHYPAISVLKILFGC